MEEIFFEDHIVIDTHGHGIILLTSDEIELAEHKMAGLDEILYGSGLDEEDKNYYDCTAMEDEVDHTIHPWTLHRTQGPYLILRLPKQFVDSKRKYTNEELIEMGFAMIGKKGKIMRILHDRAL
jgi:hypothetical protein